LNLVQWTGIDQAPALRDGKNLFLPGLSQILFLAVCGQGKTAGQRADIAILCGATNWLQMAQKTNHTNKCAEGEMEAMKNTRNLNVRWNI
jgi:hypothetical protein